MWPPKRGPSFKCMTLSSCRDPGVIDISMAESVGSMRYILYICDMTNVADRWKESCRLLLGGKVAESGKQYFQRPGIAKPDGLMVLRRAIGPPVKLVVMVHLLFTR